jgi:hypothetical protein
MVAVHAEITQAFLLRLPDRNRRWRGGGFKADSEKHHRSIGMGAGDLQRVADRIHHPHIRAARLGFQQGVAVCAPGTRSRSP